MKPGRRPSFGPRPGRLFELLQHFRRALERKPRFFEGIDDLFETGYFVIEGDDRNVGVLIDLRLSGLCNVCEGPTDPVPGEGSLAVWQQDLDDPLLGHGRRGADQDGQHNSDQHQKTRS